MALQRTTHWATRELHEFLLQRAQAPFAWGVNDCALFAADAIRNMTGEDIAADFRGKYTDEAGAWKTAASVTGIANATVADCAAWCAAKAGLAEWQPARMAQRGDLAIVRNGAREISGIVHLNGRHVVSVAETGLVRLPITAIVRAWHV